VEGGCGAGVVWSKPMASGHHHSDDPTVDVDESLIEAMLALSPEERLRHNDRMIRTIELMRNGLNDKAGRDAG